MLWEESTHIQDATRQRESASDEHLGTPRPAHLGAIGGAAAKPHKPPLPLHPEPHPTQQSMHTQLGPGAAKPIGASEPQHAQQRPRCVVTAPTLRKPRPSAAPAHLPSQARHRVPVVEVPKHDIQERPPLHGRQVDLEPVGGVDTRRGEGAEQDEGGYDEERRGEGRVADNLLVC
jgi:hypothetical protein